MRKSVKKVIALAGCTAVIFTSTVSASEAVEVNPFLTVGGEAHGEKNDVIKIIVLGNSEWEKASSELQKYGIMNGDPDGNMRTNAFLTRAEAAALIFRIQGFNAESMEQPSAEFTDMENHWAYKEVMYMQKSGLIDDISGTSFEPEKNMSVNEFVKMVVDVLGYKQKAEVNGGYPDGYMKTADELGALADFSAATDDYIRRGEAAVILKNALDIPLMMQTSFGSSVEYTVMNGQNGASYITLRKNLVEKK